MKAHSRLRSVAQVTLGNKVPESTRQASKVLLPHSVLCFFSSTTTTPVTVLCYYSIQQELETGLPVQDWDLVSNVSPFFTIPSYLLLTIGSGPRSTFPISHAVAFPRDSPFGVTLLHAWVTTKHDNMGWSPGQSPEESISIISKRKTFKVLLYKQYVELQHILVCTRPNFCLISHQIPSPFCVQY